MNPITLTALVTASVMSFSSPQVPVETGAKLSERQISLENRLPGSWGNEVYKDNILLNYAYLAGRVNDEHSSSANKSPNWDEIRKNSEYTFTLQPEQVFAFHEDTLPEYDGKVVKTTGAHFNSTEGFKSDGNLTGMGVCHFASVIYWAAKDAGLESIAPSNHDFAVINEVPKEYGVAIYNEPGAKSVGARQNLYIKNNKPNPVTFKFVYDGTNLIVSIHESK